MQGALQPPSVSVAAQNGACGPDPNITSWTQLAEVPTFRIPGPLLKIWIESATGTKKTVRLLESTAASDPDNGIQRPKDYGYLNHRVWFAAG